MQFYNAALSEAQILALSACETDAQVLAQCATLGIAAPWYLNMNPKPTDVQDKSGNGHHPSWDGTGRPTLWSSGTGSESAINVAPRFRLEPCVPNPFHSAMTLGYSLDAAGAVHIRIYDQAGKIVRVLSESAGQAGRYAVAWDGKDMAGRTLSSGVYVFKITVNNAVYTSRAVRVR
jgi:hypothetical protein